jgi:hypothetical protein
VFRYDLRMEDTEDAPERPLDRLVKADLATPPSRPKGEVDWTPVACSGTVSDLIAR